MDVRRLVATTLFCITAACASNNHPVVGVKNPTNAPTGTIAGIVSAGDGSTPVTGRKVTAINTATAERVDATTAANGG